MKKINFVKMPGEVRQFVVNDDATVKDLLELAGVEIDTVSEMEIMADDEHASLGTSVSDYDLISLTKRIKGNK